MNHATSFARPAALVLVLALALGGCGGGDTVIGGTLSGLGDGSSVVLQNNNADDLTLTANGSFSFRNTVDNGATYSVTVLTQPIGQFCNVSNGSGTVDTSSSESPNVAVACSANASVGGTLTGLLDGRSITLANGVQRVTVAQNGSFAFPGVLPAGSTYTVAIVTQPAGQICNVINGTGTVVANVMATVAVTCG